eukprot:914866-Prorocentrum_lima.AAC.1
MSSVVALPPCAQSASSKQSSLCNSIATRTCCNTSTTSCSRRPCITTSRGEWQEQGRTSALQGSLSD